MVFVAKIAFLPLAWLMAALLFPGVVAGFEAETKPKLAYLLSVDGASKELAEAAGFDAVQKRQVEGIAETHNRRLSELKQVSDVSLAAIRDAGGRIDPRLSGLNIQAEAARFNGQAVSAELEAYAEISEVIGDDAELVDEWIEDRWRREVAEHGVGSFIAAAPASGHRVYATQYLAYTEYEVAIPDKYIKFANLGWEHQPGYEGSNYTVNLHLSGREVLGVKPLDVGPWNIDDNYWNSGASSVRPRRLYADLPVGMPESQAAFFDNYNGGKDQFDRIVLNPAGIDLAPAVAADLGLAYLQNAWIEVNNNWEAAQFGVTRVKTPAFSTAQSKTTTFIVSWSGSDPDFIAGLSSYDVQYRPANTSVWTNWKEKTTQTAADFSGIAGRTYYFRARARATDGQIGQWSPVGRTIVAYDQNRLVHRRAGFSRTFSGVNSGYYLGTTRHSTVRGTFIVYKFSGSSVALISATGPTRSKAKIYIDGQYVKTIDSYSPKTRTRRLVFHRDWSESRTHYIKIVNLATPGRERLDIDGLAVGR